MPLHKYFLISQAHLGLYEPRYMLRLFYKKVHFLFLSWYSQFVLSYKMCFINFFHLFHLKELNPSFVSLSLCAFV